MCYPNLSITSRIWQDQFLSDLQLVWIQRFPSPKPVATFSLKRPNCSAIYPLLEDYSWIFTFPYDIKTMQNASSILTDMNTVHRVYFLWELPDMLLVVWRRFLTNSDSRKMRYIYHISKSSYSINSGFKTVDTFLINWLVLTACQLIWAYFQLSNYGIFNV